ncbi:hypothetical protein ACQPW3_22975 [Actinosynnema sp. CA-248983]
MVSAASGKCLQPAADGPANGTLVKLHTCRTGSVGSQAFTRR